MANYKRILIGNLLLLFFCLIGQKASAQLGKNPAYLKYSAAHSTIILDNTNVSEIKESGFNTNIVKKVNFEKKDDENLTILTGTHNGYLKNYKKICKRTLFISKEISLEYKV